MIGDRLLIVGWWFLIVGRHFVRRSMIVARFVGRHFMMVGRHFMMVGRHFMMVGRQLMMVRRLLQHLSIPNNDTYPLLFLSLQLNNTCTTRTVTFTQNSHGRCPDTIK